MKLGGKSCCQVIFPFEELTSAILDNSFDDVTLVLSINPVTNGSSARFDVGK